MGTKNNPGKFDCYDVAEPDEPMFILLGRDPISPVLVEDWANRRIEAINKGQKPHEDWAKIGEARLVATQMRLYWRDRMVREGKLGHTGNFPPIRDN